MFAAVTNHWASDASTTHCQGCKKAFDLVNRKHHCRLCGHIFCDLCSKWKINLAELGISDGRSCEHCHVWLTQKLPLLQREAIFQKVEADGSDYEVRLRLAPDQESLQWKSEKFNFGLTEHMPLEDYRQLVVGQQTSNFSRSQARFFLTCCLGNRIQTYEDRSFSLLFSDDRSLDLVALSVDAMEGWLDAFRELIARRKTSSTAVIKDTVRQQQVQAEQQNKQDIKNKYASKTTQLKSKYGATN